MQRVVIAVVVVGLVSWTRVHAETPKVAPQKTSPLKKQSPQSGSVEKVPLHMKYSMPDGFTPSAHPKLTPTVKKLNQFRKNLEALKQLPETIAGLLKLERALKQSKSPVTPLVWWEVYFGLGVGYAYTSFVYVSVAESYFRKALPYTATLDRMKAAESNYNIACALSLRGKVTESLTFLDRAFIEEDKAKVDAHFRSSQLDDTLANVRKDPRYRKLMQKYAVKKPGAKSTLTVPAREEKKQTPKKNAQ